MKLSKNTIKELSLVSSQIKRELTNIKIIKEIYDYIFKIDGKKTRALLSLLASNNKNSSKKSRINLATIIELLHTATLIHDDVVDDSYSRRGKKSVNYLWTNGHSVLMGDFIYSKAFKLMVDLDDNKILKELSSATNDIATGELVQLDSFGQLKITESELKKINYLKTGRLFEAASKTGAILGASNMNEVKTFASIGKNIGIAFQIKDDLLDYECNNKKIGKPKLKDFKEGKITLPLFYALQSNAGKRNFLLSKLGKKISKKDEREVSKYILSGESLLVTKKTMQGYINLATKNIARLKTHPSYDEMLELLEFIQGREK